MVDSIQFLAYFGEQKMFVEQGKQQEDHDVAIVNAWSEYVSTCFCSVAAARLDGCDISDCRVLGLL